MYTLEQLHVFADMPFLVFVKDKELKYVWGNKCFLDLLGFRSLDELVGRKDHDLIWSSYADTLNENDRLAMSSGKPVNLTESSNIPSMGIVGGRVCKFPAIVDGKRCLIGVALLLDK